MTIQPFIPISQLPLAGRLFGDEMVAIVKNGITMRSTTGIIGGGGSGPGPGPATATQINTESLVVSGVNSFSMLTQTPDGSMITMFVNGRAFSNVSTPPSFNVSGRTIGWVDPNYAVSSTDEVVITYTYTLMLTSTLTAGLSPTLHVQPLTVSGVNAFPNLTFAPDGQMTIMYVNGRAFSDVSTPPSFHVSGVAITWLNTSYSVTPVDEVVMSYTSA